MANLKPVNWKEVAKRGCFVYAYLRQHDHTPYYIGIASYAYRPQERHTCALPASDDLIVLMRSGLTWQQACDWEKLYIERFGRIQLGGILHNRTDGGDGCLGLVVAAETRKQIGSSLKQFFETEQGLLARQRLSVIAQNRTISGATRQKISAALTGQQRNERQKANISASLKGRNLTDKTKLKISVAHKGKSLTSRHKRALSEAHTGVTLSVAHKDSISKGLRGIAKTSNHKLAMREARQRSAAARNNVPYKVWVSLTQNQRSNGIKAAKKAGIEPMDYFKQRGWAV